MLGLRFTVNFWRKPFSSISYFPPDHRRKARCSPSLFPVLGSLSLCPRCFTWVIPGSLRARLCCCFLHLPARSWEAKQRKSRSGVRTRGCGIFCRRAISSSNERRCCDRYRAAQLVAGWERCCSGTAGKDFAQSEAFVSCIIIYFT